MLWASTVAIVALGVISASSRDAAALSPLESRVVVASVLLTQAMWIGSYALWGARAVIGRTPKWMQLLIQIKELERKRLF